MIKYFRPGGEGPAAHSTLKFYPEESSGLLQVHPWWKLQHQ